MSTPATPPPGSPEHWHAWLQRYGGDYTADAERRAAYDDFKANLDTIQAVFSQSDDMHTAGYLEAHERVSSGDASRSRGCRDVGSGQPQRLRPRGLARRLPLALRAIEPRCASAMKPRPSVRACSSADMPIPTNPDILRAVHTVYTTDLGLPEEWTDDQQEEFIRAEADKITWMARAEAETLAEASIRHWVQRNRQTPDPVTQSALRTAARAQAVRQVLSGELYELIAVDDD